MRPYLLLLLLLMMISQVQAQENAYDVLGKVLNPYAQLLSGGREKGRALQMAVRVEQTGDTESALKGALVQVSLQMPARLRITAPYAGEEITLCRDGEKVWAYPGSRLKALLTTPSVARQLPVAEPGFKLRPFEMPIPEKQLAFLPVLFQVRDAGTQMLGAMPCRVLDVKLQKQLGAMLEVEKSTGQLWVDSGYQLQRLIIHGERGDATLRMEQTKFLPALPEETWAPTAEQSGDLMKVPPKIYDQIVRALIGRGSNVK